MANICDIFFQHNRNKFDLVLEFSIRYSGNDLIFVRIFKGITLFITFKLLRFLYMRTKYVHFLI